jgi:hypothetical protein
VLVPWLTPDNSPSLIVNGFHSTTLLPLFHCSSVNKELIFEGVYGIKASLSAPKKLLYQMLSHNHILIKICSLKWSSISFANLIHQNYQNLPPNWWLTQRLHNENRPPTQSHRIHSEFGYFWILVETCLAISSCFEPEPW